MQNENRIHWSNLAIYICLHADLSNCSFPGFIQECFTFQVQHCITWVTEQIYREKIKSIKNANHILCEKEKKKVVRVLLPLVFISTGDCSESYVYVFWVLQQYRGTFFQYAWVDVLFSVQSVSNNYHYYLQFLLILCSVFFILTQP